MFYSLSVDSDISPRYTSHSRVNFAEFSDGNYSSNERGLRINDPSNSRSNESIYNQDNDDKNSAFPFYETEEQSQDVLNEEHIAFHNTNKKEKRTIYMELVCEHFSILRFLVSTFYVFYPSSSSNIDTKGAQGNVKLFLEAVCFSHPLTLVLEANQLRLSSGTRQGDIIKKNVAEAEISSQQSSSLSAFSQDECFSSSIGQHDIQSSAYSFYRAQLLLFLSLIYLFLLICLSHGLLSVFLYYFYPRSMPSSHTVSSSASTFEELIRTAEHHPAATEQRHLLGLLDFPESLMST
jgi:hypothetical protein